MTPSRVRALWILWMTLGGVMLAAMPVLALAVALGVGTDTLFGAATVGIRGISIPILEKTRDSGLDLAFGYVLVNGTVIALLWGFVALVRRRDPARGGRPPRPDPGLVLLKPLPAFRRIRDERLKPLFVALAVVPFCAPSLLGVVFAVAVLHGVQPGNLVATAFIACAMLAPHGVFELTAVFLPLAVLLALYLDTRADLEAGGRDAVWERIRASTTRASLRVPVALSIVLLVLAAVIEAHLTIPIVERLEALWT